MTIRILVTVCMILSFASCNMNAKMKKHDKAQENATYIINNLDNVDVIKAFPEKYFPKDQTEKLLTGIKENCDWQNRKGKFVDFFTMNIDGDNKTAYIYEYFLKCDSLRFVLIYDMEQENPELFKLNIEPLEQPSKMIIDPGKQLMNQ